MENIFSRGSLQKKMYELVADDECIGPLAAFVKHVLNSNMAMLFMGKILHYPLYLNYLIS